MLRWLGAGALVAAVICLVVGLRQGDEAAASATGSPAATTAVFSPRRAPFLFVDAVAQHRLDDTLTQYLAPYNACAAVAGPDGGDPSVQIEADVPMAPASTMKLLTGAAALAVLGPEHTFTTRAVFSDGTLTLIGAGDPVLSTPGYADRLHATPRTHSEPVTPLAALADAIVASGVRNVATIAADDSRYDDVRFLPDWDPDYVTEVGPLGALTVDDGTANGARVADPALNAAEQLRQLLAARGVTVGGIARGTAPANARVVGAVTSPPLSQIVQGMITASDNDTAEMLTREIGVARGGDGSTAAGTRTIEKELQNLGIPTTGFALHDGSGLAKSDRITCNALLDVIERLPDPEFSALDQGLPVAGHTGTLIGRLANDPLTGVLRAKTGYVDGVAGLAGVVDDSEHLRFAFVANDRFSATAGRNIADQVARILATYPDVPDPSQIVPAP